MPYVTAHLDSLDDARHRLSWVQSVDENDEPEDAYVVESTNIDAYMVLIAHGYEVGRSKSYLRLVGPAKTIW